MRHWEFKPWWWKWTLQLALWNGLNRIGDEYDQKRQKTFVDKQFRKACNCVVVMRFHDAFHWNGEIQKLNIVIKTLFGVALFIPGTGQTVCFMSLWWKQTLFWEWSNWIDFSVVGVLQHLLHCLVMNYDWGDHIWEPLTKPIGRSLIVEANTDHHVEWPHWRFEHQIMTL